MTDRQQHQLEALARASMTAGSTRAPSSLHHGVAQAVSRTRQARHPLARLRDPMPAPDARPRPLSAPWVAVVLVGLLVAIPVVGGGLGRPPRPALPSVAFVAEPLIVADRDLWVLASDPQRLLALDALSSPDPGAVDLCAAIRPPAPPALCGGQVHAIAWSPDGSQLALLVNASRDPAAEPWGLLVYRPGDGSLVRLAGCEVVPCDGPPGLGLTWTDGGMAVAVAPIAGADPAAGDYGLVVDAGDGSLRRRFEAPAGGYGAVPSPDGTRLAWATDTGLFVGDADGSDPVRLYEGTTPAVPAWSPDGTRLAFGHLRLGRIIRPAGQDYGWEILVVAATGGPAEVRYEVGQCCKGGGYVSRATWSPDGGLLAFHALGQVVVIDADSGARRWHLVDAVAGLDAPTWRARP